MFCMLPLRLFAVYFLFIPDIPADVTSFLSVILTSVHIPYSLMSDLF